MDIGSFQVAGDALLRVDEAWDRLARAVLPLGRVDTVALANADGRVLAETVTSAVALPRFDNSAMDGWAVRRRDLSPAGPTLLPQGGRIAAGHSSEGVSAAGKAVRIFTGAPLPADADLVVMQEDATVEPDGRVRLPALPRRSDNVRRAGEDVALDAVVLSPGRRLRPQDVALAAAAGRATLRVAARLRVALFSTGDEVREPGSPLGPAAIYDSNRVLLHALLRRAGAEVTDLGILADDRTALTARLREAAAGHDLVLTSGGVSAGEEDHVRAAVAAQGALAFWKLAIKPGRPVALGRVGGTPFLGLPGNPVAAFIAYAHVGRPLLARLTGEHLSFPGGRPVRAGFRYASPLGRRDFLRVRLATGADGLEEAVKHPHDGASSLPSLSDTAGLLVVREDVADLAPGAVAPFVSYAELW
ncbi:MAG: gephyrin-like molybdotransferase Glp [Alsobacter sp.]